MTTAIAKTRAEEQIAAEFARRLGELPGDDDVRRVRRAAMERFSTLGLPHRRIEAWKYTDLRTALKDAPPAARAASVDAADLARALGPLAELDASLIVLVNGRFAPALSRLGAAGPGLHFDPFAGAAGRPGFDWVARRLAGSEGVKAGAVVALNTAFASDGALVRIAAGAKLSKPVHLVFLAVASEPASVATRSLIEVGKGTEAVIVESHVSLGAAPHQCNAATEISVGEGARVEHVQHLARGTAATHLGTWIASLGAGAEYRAFQLTAGIGLARNEVEVVFAGSDARLDCSGAFLARGREHVDTTLVIDHAVPRCTGRELFKGVLDGQARGIVQGKVIVRPDAQKTDGKQMAQALLLSPDAEFDSKPELEIYADDVVCGHGSTAAELDEDLLFYCRSRGIPLAAARALLIESFIGEALDKVEHEGVRAALEQVAGRWLAAGAHA